ncbi:MAG TPA: hypothetical protein VED40_14915 [Azospirillaceae bacterium]|nr:hypothetical protein [Azospirillaceae bacterium]
MTLRIPATALRLWFAACLILFPLAPAPAAGSGFPALEGRWQGTGTFGGTPARFSVEFRPLFAGRFWELSFRAEAAAPQPPGEAGAFEGRATYAPAPGGKGRWIDSRGNQFTVTHEWREGRLESTWGPDGTAAGTSRYTVEADGSLTVQDFILRDGKPLPMARATLRRAP